MIRGGLLTRYWLEEGIREESRYRALTVDAVDGFALAIAPRWYALAAMELPSEAETESEFIYPVLDRLGWLRLPQQQPGSGRQHVADELLFLSAADKTAAQKLTDKAARFRHGAVVVENEARDTRLDRAHGQAEAPSHQILRYLKRSDGIPGSTVRWGLLTNGRFWRLYFAGAQARDEQFIEMELGGLLQPPGPLPPTGADPQHWLRVFMLLFGAPSLVPDPQGHTFLDRSLAEGRRFEEHITDRLSEAVFVRVFPELVEALARASPERPVSDAEWRAELKQSALVLLFRFLFVLYAEDRGLLPVENRAYQNYSFRKLRDNAAEVAEQRLAVRERGNTWWAQIRDLFDAIKHGSTELGLPEYNGDLFEDAAHPLLATIALPDPLLARLLDDLSRAEVQGRRRTINYRDLTVQQLGAIYEHLLERDVSLDGGQVKVTPDDTARHRTGSFFTTQKLVELIIARAIGPLLDEKRAAFQAKLDALRADRRPAADKLADLRRFDPADAFTHLRICDPAMGSGHFLVSLVDYLAAETLAAMAEANDAVKWADYRSPLAGHIAEIRTHIREQADAHGWVVREEHLDDKALLRRIILKRCVYGVDLNPLAVELAKLALWLHCFTVGAPLSFLDHHLRVGNSLLGERVGDVLRDLHQRNPLFAPIGVQSALNAAAGMAQVERLTDADITEVRASAEAFERVEEMTAGLRRFLDFFQASRWVVGKAESAGVKAFFDGSFGDPGRIIAGTEKLHAPADDPETRSVSGSKKNTRRVAPEERGEAFRAFSGWWRRVPALAAEHRFLHWQPAFPEVWTEWESIDPRGGFDAVIGNPPYVRQEQIKDAKPALKGLYDTFDGVADLYVYFYEQGLRLLRKGGRLSFVVTNKWIKAGYAEKLRAKLGREAWVESIVDFGHAKGFFPDADVMPSVIVARRPDGALDEPTETAVAVIPRDAVDMTRLPEQVRAATFLIPRANLGAEGWVLEPPEVTALMQKIRRAGIPLKDYAGVSPRRGVLTGYNEAFVIDTATRERLIREDPGSEAIIKPYLRGQDVDRWIPDWDGQWMILIQSSANRKWPWSTEDEGRAEQIFSRDYPALHRYFEPHRAKLKARQDQGRFFWELRECAYYGEFDQPKIAYQEIQFHPQYGLELQGTILNNKCCFIVSGDPWLLACLNSPLLWAFNWRFLGHAKDEALTPQAWQMELTPIAARNPAGDELVQGLCKGSSELHLARRLLGDWYRDSLDIDAIPNVLRNPFALDADAFVAAIRKARGATATLSAASVQHIREEHARTVVPMARRLAEAMRLEQRLSDLVNQAYGLTPEAVALMWRTAPPRMPIPAPERA